MLLPLLVCAGLSAQNIVAAKSTQETKGGACNMHPTSSDPTPCFMRGDEPLMGAPMTNNPSAGYNCPGNISLSDCWDVYADVSYIFWYAGQDGLDLAASGYVYDSTAWQPAVADGKVTFQDGKYTSGFKVGIGANLNVDDWVADLTYTYLRQQTETHSGSLPEAPSGSVAAFNVSGWFVSDYYGGQSVATTFKSKWKMHLDWLDLQFSRPCYQGKRFLVSPSFGLRASWIRQHLHMVSPDVYSSYEFSTPVNNASSNYSTSWGIGPRALVGAEWLVAAGFRFQGNVGGSILFTQFTNVSHREASFYDGATASGGAQMRFPTYNCLRSMAEANLGVGWGRYFYDKTYHLDLSATYDFNYLWSQNMMRYLLGASNAFSSGGASGDLVLHGLDVKVRFDF